MNQYEIYLDTETIDLPENIEGDIMFELAFITKDIKTNKIAKFHEYFKPESLDKMTIEAMERTQMTPELIREEASKGSLPVKKALSILCNDPNNILYIHNSKFDLEVLKRAGIVPKCKVVCTLRVANVLNDVMNLPFKSTRLSYLHYYYRNDLKITSGDFHTADYDCLLLMELINTWKEKIEFNVETAIKITNNPINYKYCHFGKNRGTQWVNMTDGQLRYFYGLGDKDICYTIDNIR